MSYIGKTTDGFGVRDRFVYVVSAGATSVSGADANGATLKFTDGAYVDVYLNGVLLKPTTDYNTSTANTIAGISSMSASDEVTVVVYDVFTVADTVSATSGGTFNGGVTVNGAFTSLGIDDNADATALTINSAENIGIGQAPEATYNANWTAVDIGNRGGIAQYKTAGDITLTYNLYHDGAWKAKETAPSARYAIGAGPYHIWYTGASASADASVTLTERMRINSNGSVGIGTATTTSDLNIGAGVGSYATIQMTPGGTSTGNIIYFGDSGDADYSSITSFGSGAGESGRMRFIAGTQEALNLYNNGQFRHTSNLNSLAGYIVNEHGTSPYGIYIQFDTASPNNTDNYFLSGLDASATRIKLYSSGTIKNSTGTYTSFSDERLKSDIVDAKSQWEDIKALNFKNFIKFDNPDFKQLGLIAQDVEKVSPNLVFETPPEPEEIKHSSVFGTLYEDGDELPENKKVGDVKEVKSQVKNVKDSILYMKAVKALQEAMTRIETLEAKVKALEEA